MNAATHIAPGVDLATAERIISEIAVKRGLTFAQAWIKGGESGDGFAGGLSFTNAHQQSAWVYACVAAITEEIANLPFRFSMGERDGENILTDGDAVRLFEQPHPMLNRFEFWEHVAGWLLLRGKNFIVGLDKAGQVVRWRNRLPAASGQPVQLIPLNPDRMQKHCFGVLQYWRYQPSQEEPLGGVGSIAFEPDEVLFLKLPLLGDCYDGLAPLSVALLAARGDYAAAQFMKGLMENNADQGMVVSTDQKLAEEQRTQIDAALRNRKRMAGRADKALILEGGLKVEKPAVSMVDLQFLENRKFSRQEICAIFRVPQEIIGFTEDANRSVSQSMRLSFVQFRILPFASRLEAGLDPAVKVFDPNLWGWFDDEQHPVMLAARRERWAGAVQAFNIGLPIDECSKQFDLGLPDDLPHAGKSYLPFSLQEVGAETALPGDQLQEPAGQQSISREGSKAAKAIEKMFAALETSPPSPLRGEPHQCAGPGADEYAASIAGSVKIKEGRLRKFFFEQRNRVLAKLEQIVKQIEIARAEGSDKQITPAPAELIRALEDLLNVIAESRMLFERIGPLLRNDLEFGVAQIGKELGLDDFKVKPEAAIDFLSRRQNMIKEINQSTFEELRSSLQEGLTAGETFDDLAARVKDIYKTATDSRAESIALTETNIAVNSGRFEGMKQAGVEKKGWKTSNLAGVRAAHLQAERDYAEGIPLAEPFIVGGEALRYPGDPNGSPGNVINCRCFTFAILGDKGISREGAKGILTFEDWTARTAAVPAAETKEAKP